MAVTAFWFPKAFVSAMNEELDVTNAGEMKLGLLTSSATVTQATHDYWNDVNANEVSSANYTLGGAALTTPLSTTASLVYTFTSDPTSWSTVSFSARYGIYYSSNGGGTDSTRPLFSYLNFGGDQSPSAANFQVTPDAAGIAKVTVS